MRQGRYGRPCNERPVRSVVTAAPYPKWRRGPNGRLLAGMGELRLEVYCCPKQPRTAHFAVLRRQYGQGSLFALIDSGSAISLFAAMRAAEQAGHRFL